MAYYDFRCTCGNKRTRVGQRPPNFVKCEDCGRLMARDWRSEKASSNFRPTVDVYANSKRWKK